MMDDENEKKRNGRKNGRKNGMDFDGCRRDEGNRLVRKTPTQK
jgi:hypothetical protein